MKPKKRKLTSSILAYVLSGTLLFTPVGSQTLAEDMDVSSEIPEQVLVLEENEEVTGETDAQTAADNAVDVSEIPKVPEETPEEIPQEEEPETPGETENVNSAEEECAGDADQTVEEIWDSSEGMEEVPEETPEIGEDILLEVPEQEEFVEIPIQNENQSEYLKFFSYSVGDLDTDGISVDIVSRDEDFVLRDTIGQLETKEEDDSYKSDPPHFEDEDGNDKYLVAQYIYDISLLKGGEPSQLNPEVDGSFWLTCSFNESVIPYSVNSNLRMTIYHEIDGVKYVVDDCQADSEIEISANHFSDFIFRFYYEGKDYTLTKGQIMNLKDLVAAVGLKGEVQKAEGDDTIFSIDNTAKTIKVIEDFDTDQTLKVTLDDGITYKITIKCEKVNSVVEMIGKTGEDLRSDYGMTFEIYDQEENKLSFIQDASGNYTYSAGSVETQLHKEKGQIRLNVYGLIPGEYTMKFVSLDDDNKEHYTNTFAGWKAGEDSTQR